MARLSNPFIQYTDGNGKPYAGAKLYFYEPGTTTLKDTYVDSGLLTPNSNPVVANSAGRFSDIFLDGTYKAVLKTSGEVVIETADPIGGTTTGQFDLWLNDAAYNQGYIVEGSDGLFYSSLENDNQGNDPVSVSTAWERVALNKIWNANITYSATDSVYGSDGGLYFSLAGTNLNHNPVTDTDSVYWFSPARSSASLVSENASRIGSFFYHGGTTAPANALIIPVAASNISRTTYAALFAVIGTTYGVGDGSTTFGLPYLVEGHVLLQSNSNVGTYTIGENLAHTHTVDTGAGSGPGDAQTTQTYRGYSSKTTSSNGGSANLAAGIKLLLCIKYQ